MANVILACQLEEVAAMLRAVLGEDTWEKQDRLFTRDACREVAPMLEGMARDLRHG